MIKVSKLALAFIAATSLQAAQACPSSQHKEVNDNLLLTLSQTGKATIEGKTYSLISIKEAGNDFNNKLLENDEQLQGFMFINKFGHAAKNVMGREVNYRALDVKSGAYCAYNISIGTNNAVIALKPEEATTEAPKRPSRPAPVRLSPEEARKAVAG